MPNQIESDLPKATILIVDDDPGNIAVLADFLNDHSFRILVAEDGESGIERASYAHPDLILLDVLMPGMDGYEACRRLKAIDATKDTPVIFMTALGETAHKIKGFEVGAVDYITKPFQWEEVLARVAVHLHIRELANNLQEAKESLESRVEERTTELARANRELQREMAERKRAEKEKESLIGELQDALSKVKLLSGFLPICASCKKIRDDKGYWRQIETYIRDHSEAEFSHSICPECAKKLYPEFS